MSEWIDVTRPLTNGIIQWPGDLAFDCKRVATLGGPGTANISEIHTCVHVGTHVDAPLHFVEGGGDVSEIPLDRLCGPAVVVDIGARRDGTVADLESAGIETGDRVLFRTANRHLWAKKTFDEGFCAIRPEAASWMVDHGVQVVGVDYLSPDAFGQTDVPVHRILLGAGVPIIEGLDLSAVQAGRYEMVALPLKIPGCEASPARVVLRRR